MTDSKQRWTQELKDGLEVLKTMRDEVRVQLHLGNMDLRARFAELEARLDNEQLLVRQSLHELIANFRLLKDELARASQPDTHL